VTTSPLSRRLAITIAAVVVTVVAITGCGPSDAPADASPATSSSTATTTAAKTYAPPPTTGFVDYQLGGAYPVPAGTTVVARDSTAKPAPGVYSICYINGFQTQPGQQKVWLKKHKSLVLHRKGKPVVDNNWPDEYILDTSTKAKRTAIAKIMIPTITSCAKTGFKAIEIDNLDTFTRSAGLLKSGNNRELAKLYATAAHKAGLAIGQKNSAEYAAAWRKKVGFDFAVAEECAVWDECGVYKETYGKRFIDIEYTDDLSDAEFATACASKSRAPLMVLRDRDLQTPSSADYAYQRC